jgi:hypothetical protein
MRLVTVPVGLGARVVIQCDRRDQHMVLGALAAFCGSNATSVVSQARDSQALDLVRTLRRTLLTDVEMRAWAGSSWRGRSRRGHRAAS